ncbi:hypothetical protein [Pedobacter psychrophilus]|uniref:hypothetical protein n=1 Tax=Pedobacter psychrophilus TaxID=1826909 RepID=UPI000A658035|nr:hypothetical protein [Pedobacter psychrophilus]
MNIIKTSNLKGIKVCDFTKEDIKEMIEKAEKGKFHSMKYLKQKISEWKEKK